MHLKVPLSLWSICVHQLAYLGLLWIIRHRQLMMQKLVYCRSFLIKWHCHWSCALAQCVVLAGLTCVYGLFNVCLGVQPHPTPYSKWSGEAAETSRQPHTLAIVLVDKMAVIMDSPPILNGSLELHCIVFCTKHTSSKPQTISLLGLGLSRVGGGASAVARGAVHEGDAQQPCGWLVVVLVLIHLILSQTPDQQAGATRLIHHLVRVQCRKRLGQTNDQKQ